MTETEKSDLPPFAYPLLRHVDYCDSDSLTSILLAAEILAIPGLRPFSDSENRAIHDSRFCATKIQNRKQEVSSIPTATEKPAVY